MPTPVPLQRFVDIRYALLASFDALLDCVRGVDAERLPADAELRALLDATRGQLWSTRVLESASTRLETVFEHAVQYNRDGDELDRSTSTFRLATLDGLWSVATPAWSFGSTNQLLATAPDGREVELTERLQLRVVEHLSPPRYSAHPAVPPEWLERARSYGLDSPGMTIDWSNVNAVALSHRSAEGAFVSLYAADRAAVFARGPRPSGENPVVRREVHLSEGLDVDAIAARIADAYGLRCEVEFVEAGTAERVQGAYINPSFSIEYFDVDAVYGGFDWTRSKTRDGWVLSSRYDAPAERRRMVEFAFVDERCGYHGFIRYAEWSGRFWLAGHFSGDGAERVAGIAFG